MRGEFYNYHPLTSFMYFLVIIVFSMFLINPICLGISLISGILYSVILNGKKVAKFNLYFMIPTIIIASFLNILFNHKGTMTIAYLPFGAPITVESICFGISASVMIACVICWFSCYNAIMTSDKFIYLFGRVAPAFSLILSMILRFVPRFKRQFHSVTEIQKCIGNDILKGSIISRAKTCLKIVSVMISWSLESSVEIADSMKSRGYGLEGRTAFSVFKIQKRDVAIILFIAITGLIVLFGNLNGFIYFRYFPSIKYADNSIYSFFIYSAYALLCCIPIIIELWEDLKWNLLK